MANGSVYDKIIADDGTSYGNVIYSMEDKDNVIRSYVKNGDNDTSIKYVDQRGLLNKINSNILARVDELYYIPENDEIPEIQRKWNIEQDDLAEIEEQEKENKKENKNKT